MNSPQAPPLPPTAPHHRSFCSLPRVRQSVSLGLWLLLVSSLLCGVQCRGAQCRCPAGRLTGRPAAVHNAAALSPAAQCLCGVTGRGKTHSGQRAPRYNSPLPPSRRRSRPGLPAIAAAPRGLWRGFRHRRRHVLRRGRRRCSWSAQVTSPVAPAPPEPPGAVRLGWPAGSRQLSPWWPVRPFLEVSPVPGELTAGGGTALDPLVPPVAVPAPSSPQFYGCTGLYRPEGLLCRSEGLFACQRASCAGQRTFWQEGLLSASQRATGAG